MANTVLLSSEKHRDLRVDPGYCRDYGDAVMSAQTFASEFRAVQAHYPILFQKEPSSGRFFAAALFGFEQGENLFLAEDRRWDAGYIPLMMQRIPFSIGVYPKNAESDSQRMLNIDLEHPKVQAGDNGKGQGLFEPHGTNTEYLDRMSGMLEAIHHWHQHDQGFIDTLVSLNLLEQVTLDINLDSGIKGQLLGFYTIHEERLAGLSGEQVAELHAQQHWEPIYMALASMPKVRALMERKSQLPG